MKFLVIGLGRAGSRIADEFAQMGKRARAERNLHPLTGAYAASNDPACLNALASKETDMFFPLLIGGSALEVVSPPPEEVASEVSLAETDRLLAMIRRGEYFETAAFLVVASAWGSFGASLAPVLGQKLKQRYVGKPVYFLITLPFDAEEAATPKRVYNAAVFLKSASRVADAIFLVDNEKLKREGQAETWHMANQQIVDPFYDLMCVSETLDPKMGSSRTVSVGDIIQTLTGFTVLGKGRIFIQSMRGHTRLATFREKGFDVMKTLEAMNQAISGMSAEVDPKEAGKAMYLVSAPSQEVSVDMTRALGNRLREMTNDGEIRGGDAPCERNVVEVVILLSQLAYVEKVKLFYDRAVAFLKAGDTCREG